jgi:hypothetical protein
MIRESWLAIGFTAMLALAPVGLKANTVTYVYTGSGVYGTLDLTSGAFTSIATSPTLQTANASGFAETGGALYAAGFANPTSGLFSVNASNGVATLVGSTVNSTVGDVFGGTTGGGLFSISQLFNLYSVSTAGAFNSVGATGLPGFAGFVALSNNGSSLFLEDDGELWSINTSTGAGTDIANGLGHDYSALIFEGLTLYGISGTEIYNVNTTNGTDTAVQAITGLSSDNIVAIAPDPVTGTGGPSAPEPGTWVLLSAGLSVLVLLRRRVCRA